jgi:hypothetical protein
MPETSFPVDTDCLYTTVQCTCAVPRIFGFLPPHGVLLNPGETYTVFGDIVGAMSRANWGGERRSFVAFNAALGRGDITIIRTPNPILLDTVTGTTKMLQLSNNSLSVATPCWFQSDSYGHSEGNVLWIGEHTVGGYDDINTPA